MSVFFQAGVALASRTCTILMSLTAFLALLASLVALALDLALWIIIRNRIRDRGFEAELVSLDRFRPTSSRGHAMQQFADVLSRPCRVTLTGSLSVPSPPSSLEPAPPPVDRVDDSLPAEWVVRSTRHHHPLSGRMGRCGKEVCASGIVVAIS